MIVNFAFRLPELINVSDTEKTVKDRHLHCDWLTSTSVFYVN